MSVALALLTRKSDKIMPMQKNNDLPIIFISALFKYMSAQNKNMSKFLLVALLSFLLFSQSVLATTTTSSTTTSTTTTTVQCSGLCPQSLITDNSTATFIMRGTCLMANIFVCNIRLFSIVCLFLIFISIVLILRKRYR